MATPINAPLTSDLWHLSIDDLLAPTAEPPRLGGPGPFVINLSASTAPLSQPAKTFAPSPGAHVYQIQRVEDRRPRYRLRLGPFVTEDEADAMLHIVRDVYPSALTATAESDDLRAIAACKPKTESAPPAAAAAVPKATVPTAPSPTAATPTAATPTAAVATAAVATAAVPKPAVPKRAVPKPAVPTAAAPSAAAATAALSSAPAAPRRAPNAPAPLAAAAPGATRPATPTFSTTAPHAAGAAARRPLPSKTSPVLPSAARPLPVPEALSIPVLSDFVEPSPRTAAPSPASRPVTAAAQAPVNPSVAAPVARAAVRDAQPPNLESTQTLRPLTTSELHAAAPRWYVIQLSLSGEGFNPDSLPNLDIFDEYRLYSVAGLDQGRIVHALRLGFFAEEGAAAAVASYLAGFYDKPTVKRISVAERERFRDQRVEARKDIGATGRHAVIEITGERHIRDTRPRIAAVRPLAPAAAFSTPAATPARKR